MPDREAVRVVAADVEWLEGERVRAWDGEGMWKRWECWEGGSEDEGVMMSVEPPDSRPLLLPWP
jgi:hypothetical protein